MNANTAPRYAQPTWKEYAEMAERAPKEGPTCADCIYYKEVKQEQNGLTEYIPTCVFDIYWAESLAELDGADLMSGIAPGDDACSDFKEM